MEKEKFAVFYLKNNKKVKKFSAGILIGVISMFAISCEDFEVDNPTNIVDEQLDDAGLATALGNTPEVAVAAALDDAIVWSAACSDEGFLSGSGTFRIMIDEGYMDGYNQQYDNLYNALASARWIADDATKRLK